jgi:hypothetical protein
MGERVIAQIMRKPAPQICLRCRHPRCSVCGPAFASRLMALVGFDRALGRAVLEIGVLARGAQAHDLEAPRIGAS